MKIKRTLAVIAVLAFALMGHGCSDGELQLGSSANPSISPFVSITADPMEIQSGGSTTLKWTVANAASVEISSDDGTFHAGPIDMSGKTEDQIQVDDIQATTTYTITATASAIEADIGTVPTDPYIPVKSGQIEIGSGDDDSADADLAAESATVTDSVTVTVNELSISFYADDGDNMACMPRVLHWEVTPSDVTIAIEASTGETVELSQTCAPEVATDAETQTEEDSEENSEGGLLYVTQIRPLYPIPFDTGKGVSISKSTTASLPATGCAVVYPCVATTYTLTATDENGSMSEDVTITPSNLIIDYDNSWIKAKGELLVAYVDSFPAEDVPISYQISPSMIPVSVETDNDSNVSGCSFPDEDGEILAQMPETVNCDISAETTFKLIAHIGDDTIEVSRVKVMADAGTGQVDITTAHAWAFEGEEVTVTVTPRTAGDAAKIAKVRIKGTDVIERVVTDATPIVEKVTVPLLGVQVEVFNTIAEDAPVVQQAVYALPLLPVGLIGKPITEAMFDPNNIERSYYGVMSDFEAEKVSSFSSSNISIWRNDLLVSGDDQPNGRIDINFGNRMMYWFDDGGMGNFGSVLGDSLFIHNTRTFPVRAIAIDDGDADKMFVGTTGAVMYSFDGGTTWAVFVGPYYTKGKYVDNYAGQHETCAGETQTGMANPDDQDLAFFSGICDIIVDGSRLYVATDKGAATYTDIEGMIQDPMMEGGVHFIPRSEAEQTALTTYKHVVNDLELLDDGGAKKLFAAVATGTLDESATVNGVYVSDDAGESWTDFGSLGVDTYAVKIDMHADQAKKIYAATADGIYVSDVDSANWQKACDDEVCNNKAVYSLADDPYTTGTIMAGLEDGAAITRDAGSEWGPLTVGGIDNSGKVTAIAMAASVEGSYVNYRAAFASDGGFLSGKVMVPVIAEAGSTNDSLVDDDEDDNTDDTTPDTTTDNDDVDRDGDGILDDGDNSGSIRDNLCTGGATVDCDDNCRNNANPDQADSDGDGWGDVCDSDPSDPGVTSPRTVHDD